MHYSVFDLFKIGPGPSSSHTMGPIKAANHLLTQINISDIASIKVHLYGSLALTGKGHSTDEAAIIGLCGYPPDKVTQQIREKTLHSAYQTKTIKLGGEKNIPFDPSTDIIFHFDEQLPLHPNGMTFAVETSNLKTSTYSYYSPGGGFINDDKGEDLTPRSSELPPHPFTNATELMHLCDKKRISIADLMLINETTWMTKENVYQQLRSIWQAMDNSIKSGLTQPGILPGGLNVKRRAPELYNKLTTKINRSNTDVLDWLSVYAMAVNEQNATGGCIVTAPTNGAAGIIPAVMKYHLEHSDGFTEQSIFDYLLTAGAIGILYKQGASLSAAEVGCQGEVGVACSMAAGGLTAISGGTIEQIENAAEIGMEHNLGLTCDPIGGLVQIPCIERNTMGAVKAVNAAHLALNSDGKHVVSLDKVIATMLKTGKDMQQQYKETSQGGLAIEVNMPEC